MERVTKFDVYFKGYVEACCMEARDLFPLLAHPKAYMFIANVEPVSVLVETGEYELPEMPKE